MIDAHVDGWSKEIVQGFPQMQEMPSILPTQSRLKIAIMAKFIKFDKTF